ncbi:MAG: methylmalonyl Co-A mutase-associated GTPase MeaB, partial [Vicinamibacteraceae bacterium]
MNDSLVERLLGGDVRALARAISLIEDEAPERDALIRAVFPHTGRAYLVGVTGPPGAGKSTLVDRLTEVLRRQGQTVGIIAVDPTSPFTGGAILGDRVRMQQHVGDAGVYIRSMATRGHLGGLARATSDAALVLDGAGRDMVLIETVGVGQDEVDVVRTADVSIVVVVPGAGDDIQALKAGIMEIGDIYVVNKADREGADRTMATIQAMLGLQSFGPGDWHPPVVATEAVAGRGVAELTDTIERFRTHTAAKAPARARDRAAFRLRDLLGERLRQHVEQHVLQPSELDRYVERIAERRQDPYSAVDEIVHRALLDVSTKVTLDHVGIAVRDLEKAIAFFRDTLGLELELSEDVPPQGVRVHFMQAGSACVELVEALDSGAPLARFLDKRGPGLHHVAFRVDDIRATLADLRNRGVRLIDEEPRPGAGGALIAFIHPSSTHGVLVEVKQASGIRRQEASDLKPAD